MPKKFYSAYTFLSLSMDEKFQIILRDSFSIFNKNGIKNTSIEKLCKTMNISKKTIYKYISNKNDLLLKIVSQYIPTIGEFISDKIDRQLIVNEQIDVLYKTIFSELYLWSEKFKLDLKTHYDDIFLIYQETYFRYFKKICYDIFIATEMHESKQKIDIASWMFAQLFSSFFPDSYTSEEYYKELFEQIQGYILK